GAVMSARAKNRPKRCARAKNRQTVMGGRLRSARVYVGALIILVWGLGPFYWMAVVALRDPDYTFDNTPWPTHLTLENFRNAFDTTKGNDFSRALVNSMIIGGITTLIAVLLGVFA